MATLDTAIALSAVAHAGQTDLGGQPYVIHTLRVMLRLDTAYDRMAGVLHDIIEDTSVTEDHLRSEGFPAEVVDAIVALTKLPGETRMQAAERAAANSIALRVKLADNAENSDMSRIPNPGPKDYARLEEYRAVREYLLSRVAATAVA